MKHNGLIFIPDISGFTQFVTSVELKHSQHIIQELLELLLDANIMELNVSDVEGNAILFYKFGELPDLIEIYQQVEKMFRDFHKHLELYETRRTCHCNACITAIHLSLKIISHYGEFTEYRINKFHSLFGKDIIISHRLLKNEITQHEYWLITDPVSGGKPPEKFSPWINWNRGSTQVDNDEINFHFAQLSHMRGK
jgi:hypothetical protein